MDFSIPISLIHANSAVLAAGSIAPDQIPGLGWFTNSLFVAILVLVAVLLFTRMATKRMEMVPGKKQNFVELVVEFLYNQVENIVGKKVAPKAFPLLATIFIFVLASNYAGLIPGVGTIGFGDRQGPLTIAVPDHSGETKAEEVVHDAAAPGVEVNHDDHAAKEHHGAHFTPILRPPTVDLNFTLGLACVFMIVWMWLTVREVGVWGFIVHTFGPKGGLEGFLKYALTPIFIFVGLIEIISIVARPVSLSLRLFGNIYAGETLLHTMGGLGATFGLGKVASFVMSVALPLPFYFMEILVGLLQATVFALLCAVFIQLSTAHDEEAH